MLIDYVIGKALLNSSLFVVKFAGVKVIHGFSVVRGTCTLALMLFKRQLQCCSDIALHINCAQISRYYPRRDS